MVERDADLEQRIRRLTWDFRAAESAAQSAHDVMVAVEDHVRAVLAAVAPLDV